MAVGSARKYLRHAQGKKISAEEISVLDGELGKASQNLKILDRSAVKILSGVEKQIRDLIEKNAT